MNEDRMKMDDHIEIGYREMQVMTILYQVDYPVLYTPSVNLRINRLNSEYDKPLLIIKGESLYGHRNVHPNVVRAVITTRNLLRRFKTIERIVTATKEVLSTEYRE